MLLALASIGTPFHASPAAPGLPQGSSGRGVEVDEVSAELGTEGEPAVLAVEVESDLERPDAHEVGAGRVDVPAQPPLATLAPDTVTLDQRMLRRMSPDFVARLKRVAERMWNEHGARVEVVEGFRDQSRQDALFAQGRTAEGPVVTWTTNSLHTTGVAADIYIDGGPVSSQQAVVLSRLAGEEGLRTLYPYDSGHLQLDGAGGFLGPDGGDPRASVPSSTGTSTPPSGAARVAPVARVARPARPGGTVMLDTDDRSTSAPRPDGRVLERAPEGTASTARAASPDVRPPEAVASRGPTSPVQRSTRPESRVSKSAIPGNTFSHSPVLGSTSLGSTISKGPVLERAGADALGSENSGSDRSDSGAGGGSSSSNATVTSLPPADAQRATAPRQGAPMQEAASITAPLEPLPFEPTDGPAYRRLHLPIDGVPGASLDIGIRPGTIDAMLNIADPRLAGKLERSLHELRQVLNNRGIDTRGLAVRLVADGPTETSPLLTDGLAARAGGDGSTPGSSSDARGERQGTAQDRTDERFRERERTDERLQERTRDRSGGRDHPRHTRRDTQKEGKQ